MEFWLQTYMFPDPSGAFMGSKDVACTLQTDRFPFQ